MTSRFRVLLAWLAVVVGAVIAFYLMLAIALSCFDCANPPSTWLLLAPWLLPAGLLLLALWVSGVGHWIRRKPGRENASPKDRDSR
jgi:hypothetical protein